MFFFLPELTEANSVAQCSFSTYTFEFAPNVKGEETPEDLDYFGTRV